MPRYIDADNLVSVLDILCDKGGDIRYWEQLKWIVADCPTADVVERKRGKWIKMSDADGVYWACSECGEEIPREPDFGPQFGLFPRLKSLKKTNFCPCCGAQMDERSDDAKVH